MAVKYLAGNRLIGTAAERAALTTTSHAGTDYKLIKRVTVGSGGSDDMDYKSTNEDLQIFWSSQTDSLSGIQSYELALGTTKGGVEKIGWTNKNSLGSATETSATFQGVNLSDGITYFASVRAIDNAGNLSAVKTGDGITIDLTAPKAGTVHDGTGADIAYSSAVNTLSGNRTGFTDATSGITDYQ